MKETINYFALLGIDPDVSDWAVIEKAIEQRRIGWSRDLTVGTTQRRREAERYLKLLPEITESLRDPERRRKIAEAAKELASKAKQGNLDRFHAHVNELRSRGRRVDQEVLDRLAANFGEIMNRSEIVAQLRDHGLTVGDGDLDRPAREWPTVERSKMAEITHLLNDVGHATLYTFLDLSPDAPLAHIQDVVNTRYKKIHRDTAANQSVNELLGYCMDIFGSAEGKEKYDNARYHVAMSDLTGMLDAKGTDGILEETELQQVLSRALELRVQAEFAANFVEEYAQGRGWILTTDPSLVIQKLSIGEQPTKPLVVDEDPKVVSSDRSDNYYDYSTPLIVPVMDGQPIEISPRVVNDRLAFDLNKIAFYLTSEFGKSWADLKSIEAAAERGVLVFENHVRYGYKFVVGAIKYIGVPISTAGFDSVVRPLVEEAEVHFREIWTTLESLEEEQSRRELIRQLQKANRARFVGFNPSGVAAAAVTNATLDVFRGLTGGVSKIKSSHEMNQRKEEVFERIGGQLTEIFLKIMITWFGSVVARLQEHGIEIDQPDVVEARRSQVKRNLKGVLKQEDLPSRIDGLKAQLAQYYYFNKKGVQELFTAVLQLDAWEAELERCAPFFVNCHGHVISLAKAPDLQVAVQGKLQSLFESPISTRQLKQSALVLRSHVMTGDKCTSSPYDFRASAWSGDDGSWKAACLAAISRSLIQAKPLQVNSTQDLRRLLGRADEGLQAAPGDVISAFDSSDRNCLVRQLIGGLAQQDFSDRDAAFLVEDIQLVGARKRKLFTAEAAKELQTTISTANLPDVVGVTTKLQRWCAALGQDVWAELASKVDAKAVHTFAAERLRAVCNQSAIGQDLGELKFLMTQICGEEDSPIVLRNTLVETLDSVLDHSQPTPIAFFGAVRQYLDIDDVEVLWASRASRKVVPDIQSAYDLKRLLEREVKGLQATPGDVISVFDSSDRDSLVRQLIGGLAQQDFSDRDAVFLVQDIQLVDARRRQFFTAEATKELQATISTANLPDVVGVTTKLQRWCAALDQDVWAELAGKVDTRAVHTFAAECLKAVCDQSAIGQDLGELKFLMTQICGEEGGSIVLQNPSSKLSNGMDSNFLR